jgi:hypothetical protein
MDLLYIPVTGLGIPRYMGTRMAKAKHKQVATPRDDSGPLSAAQAAYERGDSVLARRLARQAITAEGATDDQKAQALALIEQTLPPPRVYLLAALAAVVFVVMLVLAASRSA